MVLGVVELDWTPCVTVVKLVEMVMMEKLGVVELDWTSCVKAVELVETSCVVIG